MSEITVGKGSKKFGVGYSFTPTGNGTEIQIPTRPDYTGTLEQCNRSLGQDRTFQAHKNSAFYSLSWFYDGQRITATWGGWVDDNDNWVAGWVRGFESDFSDSKGKIKVRVA